MSSQLALPKNLLDSFIRTAPHRYKIYQVPKRSGSGMRIIAQPAKQVKALQYCVIHILLKDLPVHNSAIAYVPGKNIRINAFPHASNPFAIKLDFKDFFPSIKGHDFLNYAEDRKKLKLDTIDLHRLVSILFWKPKLSSILQLSIGAPSSPLVSNLVMYDFDGKISDYCAQHQIVYTRYADDMTFSMWDKEMRGNVLKKVLEVLSGLPFPKLTLNHEKTVFCSKAHRRMVTGLILTNDGDVSLGRDRKRTIRAQIHYFSIGKLPDDQRSHLRGMLAFARDIEPDFISRMEHRYGENIIKSI